MERGIPKIISTEREVAYLKALAATGNATLAAARARVSKSWAYKRREADPRFDALFREMKAIAKSRLRVRMNRERKGGWTAEKEARFVERLGETCSVPLAAAEVGLSAGSAYQRRQRRPGFAAAWDEALLSGWPPADHPWIESAICFFEGEQPPPGNHVRITSVSEVLGAMWGTRFAPRKPRALR